MNIDFPQYFDKNPNFNSLMLGTEKFVEYAHQLDAIKNVQLRINQTFLVYVVHGQAQFVTPNTTIFANEGDAVLVKKGAYIMSESLSEINNQFKAFLFFISDQMVIDFFAENQLNFSPYKSTEENHTVILVEVNNQMRTYLGSIRLLLDEVKQQNNQQTFIQLKAKELLYHLVNTASKKEVIDVFSYSYPGDFIRLKKVMETNYIQPLDIADLAFLCEMSLATFKSKFKEVYQTTPAKWIKEKRLVKAQQLLEHTDFSLAEIGKHIGFADVDSFIHAYKTKYKSKPRT